MKNVQVIDSGYYATFSIFQVTDSEFNELFPEEGQNVEFRDDLYQRLGDDRSIELMQRLWDRQIEKEKAKGVHGTLFFGFEHQRDFYPNRRESDFDSPNLEPLL